jgi:hypothetical protein
MTDQLTIKLSTDADRQRIERLAALDSRRAPQARSCWPRSTAALSPLSAWTAA